MIYNDYIMGYIGTDRSFDLKTLMICLILILLYIISQKVSTPSYIFSIVDKPFDYSDYSSNRDDNKNSFKWGQLLKNNWASFTGKKRDLIERINKSDEKIYKLSYYDPLTSLPNRTKLLEEFETSLIKSETKEKAVFLIDIDRFHTINELYGREVGDRVLIGVAKRLHTLLGQEALIFRESEDELFIFIDDTSIGHRSNL